MTTSFLSGPNLVEEIRSFMFIANRIGFRLENEKIAYQIQISCKNEVHSIYSRGGCQQYYFDGC